MESIPELKASKKVPVDLIACGAIAVSCYEYNYQVMKILFIKIFTFKITHQFFQLIAISLLSILQRLMKKNLFRSQGSEYSLERS